MRDYSLVQSGGTSPSSPSTRQVKAVNKSSEHSNSSKEQGRPSTVVVSPALLSPAEKRRGKEAEPNSLPETTVLSPALLSPAGSRQSRGASKCRKPETSDDDDAPRISDPQQLLKHAQAQADKFAHLKPSEIRKLIQAEKEKKLQQKLHEQESLLKMQKYRAEINAIRQRQQEEAEESQKGQESISRDNKNTPISDRHPSIYELEQKASEMEDPPSSMQPKGETEETHDRTMSQMKMSFAALQQHLDLDSKAPPSLSVNASGKSEAAASKPGPSSTICSHRREPHRHLRPDGMGKLEKGASRRSLLLNRQGSSRRAGLLERTVSNRVPEMRRRASKRDLMFTEDDSKLVSPAPRHSPQNNVRANTTIKEKVDPELESKKKREEEKQLQTQKELDEAKEHFETGYELCWNLQDSSKALEEYRLALLTRETLLGKYHEDTARTYYWIGRSLVKLTEYAEALVAFSRAARIFERVTRKNHKYNIWCATAIENCFQGMKDQIEDWEEAYDEYKKALETSIMLERRGDTFRKQGKLAEAISEYRGAIDQMEDYHPDAADIYQKIAIIMRQQGDFEGALQEFRYASEIYEMSLGADHPETVKTLNNLMDKKKMNQMSRLLQEKLEMRKG